MLAGLHIFAAKKNKTNPKNSKNFQSEARALSHLLFAAPLKHVPEIILIRPSYGYSQSFSVWFSSFLISRSLCDNFCLLL